MRDKPIFLMNVRRFPGLLLTIPLTLFCLPSCHTLKQADRADRLLDYVMTTTGNARPDVAPIEKATTGQGEIVTARAVLNRDHVSVCGSVRKQSVPGWVSAAYAHVDILVLNSHREIAEALTTYFSPSLIPKNQRGQEGHSNYCAALKAIPNAGSVIRVIFHNIPERQCEFYRSGWITKAKT
jgi:hypothetical protein